MENYCIRFRKKAEKLNSIFKKKKKEKKKSKKKKKKNLKKNSKTKNYRLIVQPKCAYCGIKKSIFSKEQEAKGLLNKLGIKRLLSKNTLLSVLFLVYKNE